MKDKMKATPILIFWLGLIVLTYRGLGEIYIAVFFLCSCVRILIKQKLVLKKSLWMFFVGYYILISLFNLLTGNVGAENLLELIIKYICMPLIVITYLPQDTTTLKTSVGVIRNVILISAVYGFLESILRYNVLQNFVSLGNREWMVSMAGSSNYQPSSFYLHYNYYGYILVVGWVLLHFLPLKKNFINIISKILILEQILICQSRIAWISFVVICMIYLFKSGKITNRKLNICLGIVGILLITLIFEPGILGKFGSFISTRFSRILIYGFQDGSLGQRLGTLRNWPRYFNNNYISGFLGTGYQSIDTVFMKDYSYFSGYSTADCQYTIYLVETGIIGIVIFWSATFKTLLKPQIDKQYITLEKIVLILFLIESITLDIASNNIILSLFYITMVIGLRIGRIAKEDEKFEI